MQSDVNSRCCELSAGYAAEDLLAQYDPATDQWSVPRDGSFWEAIRRAHDSGYRGQGRRVAVIDTSCDFSIPRIRRQTGGKPKLPGPHGEPTAHGTAVALLVGTVAPDCAIDIYEISRNGRPEIHSVVKAIGDAAKSEAQVICLSLGVPTEIVLSEETDSALRKGDLRTCIELAISNEGRTPIREESRPCAICDASSKAAIEGKMVFAAVGNDAGAVYCPARSRDVVAVGFQLAARHIEELENGGQMERAESRPPSYDQSCVVDFTLMQLTGALGSSFACPLVAGAAALGIKQQELAGFLKSARLTAIADFFLPTLSSTSPREFVEFVGNVYQEAFAAHPHQHKTAGNAAGCLGCSIFSEQLYVNGGLYFLERGALDKAEQSLRTARWFAPWSPDAAANLGRTLQARAELMLTTANNVVAATRLLDEAINHYSDALGLRPGFRPYQLQLDEIYGLRKRLA